MSVDWMVTHRGVLRWAAVGVPILLAAVLALLRGQLTPSTATMVLVLAVVGVSATGDRAAGVASAVSAAVALDFFLTVPHYSLSVYDRENVELAICLRSSPPGRMPPSRRRSAPRSRRCSGSTGRPG